MAVAGKLVHKGMYSFYGKVSHGDQKVGDPLPIWKMDGWIREFDITFTQASA